MMICRADFEELLPHLFESEQKPAAKTSPGPSDACIERWLDDGGSIVTQPARKQAPKSGPVGGQPFMTDLVHEGHVSAPMLAAALYAPMWALLAGFAPQVQQEADG